MTEEETEDRLAEARALIDVSWNISDDDRRETVFGWINDLLAPLVNAGNPDAIFWLETISTGEDASLSEEEALARYREHITKLADQNHTEAMFRLSLLLHGEGNFAPAADYCKRAAADGHAYANWCCGLDLLAGQGVTRDEALGLKYIQTAAELYFEGALKFMADAHTFGQHGFPVDTAEAANWHRKLSDPKVIPF